MEKHCKLLQAADSIWQKEDGSHEAFASAKINIGLYVVERRPDGYHNLETVFYPISLHDNLHVGPLHEADGPYRLQLAGNAIEGNPEDNLIIKAYRQLAADYPLPPIDIYLYKRVPTGAGLGGGSSDAAYMMKVLNQRFELGMDNEEMKQRVARLGADCAFFIDNHPAFATGIGDVLTPCAVSLKGMTLLLVKPDTFVSTKEAYGGVTPQRPRYDLREAIAAPVETWKDTISNDFEISVFQHHPEIAAIKQTLYDMGAVYASMSGSGSTVFGLFRHPVEEAQRVFADCFVYQSQLEY